MKRIEKFLESCVGKKMYREEIGEFRKRFFELVENKNRIKVDSRNTGINAINLFIKEDKLLFEVFSVKDRTKELEKRNKRYWTIVKLNSLTERRFSKEYHKKEIKKFPYDKEKSRESRLKTFFGLSVEEYNKMLHSQNYSCSICRVPAKNFTQSLAVDHNHDTNQIRGLLCTRCNVLLGYAHESTELLQSAIDYLIYWGGINA